MTPGRHRPAAPWASRGIALPLTLFAIMIVGAIVATVLWVALIGAQAAGQVRHARVAWSAADGVWPVVADQADALGVAALLPGDSLVVPHTGAPGGVTAGAVVYRLNSQAFLISASGVRGATTVGAVQALVRLDSVADSTGWQLVLVPLLEPFWSALPRVE